MWRIAVGMLVLAAGLPAEAGMLSKTFRFKPGVVLEVGEATDDGLRLDSVRFALPSTAGGENMRTGGVAEAEVALSNTANVSLKGGVALAVFDGEGRLLGVSSAGNHLGALKPGRAKTFKLIFDNVNRELFRGASFQISVESRR